MDILRKADPVIARMIENEKKRENEKLRLIASENYVSAAILCAQGSGLTNKYAEGYPSKRYYEGCENIDEIEKLAIDRAKQLFGAQHVNVQPHSGSQANMAVLLSMLELDDVIMGMNLSSGGHITHGAKVNFSGKCFKSVSYYVDEKTELIDYDAIRVLARKYKPKMIIAGASSYPRIIDFKKFREIADEIGAYFMADIAHISGLVIAGLHPNPVPYADFVTTSTHKTLRGPRGGLILCAGRFAEAIDKMVFPGIQGGPLMHVIAAKAVAFKEASSGKFKTYQKQIVANAKKLGSELMKMGYKLVTNGTDNHLILMDLRVNKLTGKEAADALDKAGITANINRIPFDPLSPEVTSGLRLGTPALTTRGMKEDEMILIAQLIYSVLSNIKSRKIKAEVKEVVKNLCKKFPVPYK